MQWAKRVVKRVDRMIGYSAAAPTAFARIFENMRVATASGQTCQGASISASGRAIYNILKDCNTSVPAICNEGLIMFYNKTKRDRIDLCTRPLL